MHTIHDFTSKLRQPSVSGRLAEYVQWRQAVERARRDAEPMPPPPKLVPVSINLDLTTACNYRCTHCIDWDVLNARHKHSDSEIRDSLRLMTDRGLRSVILIGGGEPTLYRGFPDFVRYLKSLGLQVALVTNGSRGKILAEAAVHMSSRDWIRMSLDSGSNELFELMHRPRKGVDLDSICEWVPRIKAANPSVAVGFSFIIVWRGASAGDATLHENINEIAMAAQRAKRFQFDYIAYKPVLERAGDGAEVMKPEKADCAMKNVLPKIILEIENAKALADDKFRVVESINLQMLKFGRWRDYTRQPRTCHVQAFRQVLSPLGLFNCPAHRGVSKARIADKLAYADEDHLQGTSASLGKLLDTFDASHECREVTCLYHSVNWWIESLIAEGTGDWSPEAAPELNDYFL